ncbi:MAG: gamma-glutamylcyclotransferase [Alphaproteobacteria bacterium]|nr:gamma-glutamylcyclotransferase [Alphaproteobacteria bacterium]
MAKGAFWIFAYGSLIWDPGFACLERVPARLWGYHRSMCIYSHVWRGTPGRPGLVLGLDKGGSCRGVALRVAGAAAAEVVDYLEARERVTAVYLARTVPITLEGGGCRKRIAALTYIADRAHHQYAGKVPVAEAARLIRGGRGRGGGNVDYLETTVRHLAELGIADAPLAALARLVSGEAG